MRSRTRRVHIATLMALIALIGAGLGVDRALRRWTRYREAAARHEAYGKSYRLDEMRYLGWIEAAERERREGVRPRSDMRSPDDLRVRLRGLTRLAERNERLVREFRSRW